MEPRLREIELSPLLAAARRYKGTIVVSTLTVTLVSLFWTLSLPRVYEATCTIEYDPQPPRPLGSQVEDIAMPTVQFWMTREWYETQNRILQSRTVAERVVTELELHRNADFMGEREPGAPEPTVREAAERLMRRVSVEQQKDTRMAEVSVEDESPERAAALANAIVEAYRERTTEERLRSTVDAVQYLAERLRAMGVELEGSDRAMIEFKRENNILWASLEEQRGVVARNLNQYSEALAATRWKRLEAQSRVNQLRAAFAQDGIHAHGGSLDDDSSIQALRRTYHEARIERDELATRAGPNWPELRALEARLLQIETQLRNEINGVITGGAREVAQLASTEAGLQAELEAVEESGNELNAHAGEYEELHRARENHSKLYTHLLQRSTEATLGQALKVETARIVDRALPPDAAISPRVPVNLLAGGVLGLVLGLGLAFLLSRLDRTIRGTEEVEALGLTVLGMLPTIGGGAKREYYYRRRKGAPTEVTAIDPARKDLIVHTHPMSALAENVRTVRTNLTFMSADKTLSTLVVVSPSPQDGKTTVAASLAIALAQSGKRVLLIDTDLRRPRVHRAFNLRNHTGITSVLVGEMSLSEAVRSTEVPGVSILPCGPVPPNPSELLHTARFRELIEGVRGLFDITIFDSPPLGAVTDAAIVAHQVDGVLVVVKDRNTTRDALASAVRQLRDVNANTLGAVVNQLEERSSRYGGYHNKPYYYSSNESDDLPRDSDGGPGPQRAAAE